MVSVTSTLLCFREPGRRPERAGILPSDPGNGNRVPGEFAPARAVSIGRFEVVFRIAAFAGLRVRVLRACFSVRNWMITLDFFYNLKNYFEVKMLYLYVNFLRTLPIFCI
jgi:hypothetical protein